MEKIEEFIDLLSYDDLDSIFHHYHRHQYDHLLQNPFKRLSNNEMKEAIKYYLKYFILKNKYEDDERKDTLTNIVNNKDIGLFRETLHYDQFFEEPLYHIANKDSIGYNMI